MISVIIIIMGASSIQIIAINGIFGHGLCGTCVLNVQDMNENILFINN